MCVFNREGNCWKSDVANANQQQQLYDQTELTFLQNFSQQETSKFETLMIVIQSWSRPIVLDLTKISSNREIQIVEM